VTGNPEVIGQFPLGRPPGTWRARTCTAFVFPTEVSGLRGRKNGDGFLFCKRCVVRWPAPHETTGTSKLDRPLFRRW